MTMPADSLLYIDDCRGINIPKDFVTNTNRASITGVDESDLTDCLDPYGEWYWEAWDNVLRDAVITGDDGKQYTLYQDGALWLILKGAEWPED